MRGKAVNGWYTTANLHAQKNVDALGKISPRDGLVAIGWDGAVCNAPGYVARACANRKGGRLRACTNWN
ncbi:hypothetical protein ACFV2Z_09500 [Streptomyces sp. NPDC059688]|uniref:hypothetical protein n=1 Tax=Streptomyces sp. NPDC059688 TaxID=3346906 RepID=UPI0036ACB308